MASIDRFRALLVELSEEITHYEFRNMLIHLVGNLISRRDAESLPGAYELFELLLERGDIAMGNLTLLEESFQAIGSGKLTAVLKEYKEILSALEDIPSKQKLWHQLQALADDGEAKKEVYRGRIMLVGAFGAGKTSTKRSLLNQPYECRHLSTDGAEIYSVDITDWVLKDTSSHHNKRCAEETQKLMTDELIRNVKRKRPCRINPGQKTTLKADLKLGGENDDDAIERIEQRLRTLEDTDKPDYYFSLWDFAGQSIYYLTHQVFLSYRCIYILVTDLTKALDEIIPISKEGAEEDIDHAKEVWKGEWSVSDFLLFWIKSIHSHSMENLSEEDRRQEQGNKTPAQSPPVVILGTKKDLLPDKHKGTEKEAIRKLKEIRQHLHDNARRCTENHVHSMIAIDNKSRIAHRCQDPKVETLRQKILELAKQHCFLGKIPIKWLQLELRLRKAATNSEIVPLDDVYKIGKAVKLNKEAVDRALKFYHNVGEIIHFSQVPALKNTVILEVEWLVNLFRIIITQSMIYKESLNSQVPQALYEQVQCLYNDGKLNEELLDYILESKGRLQDKEILLCVMEKFDITCQIPQSTNASDSKLYILPCMLRSDPDKTIIFPPSSELHRKLYYHFPGNFIPDGLFYRLLVRCGKQWHNSILFRDQARFFVTGSPDFYCSIAREGSDIGLTMFRIPLSKHPVDNFQIEKWYKKAREMVEEELNALIQVYTPGLAHEVSLKCECDPTHAHQWQADHLRDSCVYISKFLQEPDDETNPLCCRNALRVDTSTLHCWYPEKYGSVIMSMASRKRKPLARDNVSTKEEELKKRKVANDSESDETDTSPAGIQPDADCSKLKTSSSRRTHVNESVLLLHEEWDSSNSEISTVHRLVAQEAVEEGFDVYVTALNPSNKEIKDTKQKNVTLIGAVKTQSHPDREWLYPHHDRHFPSLKNIPNLRAIVGHIPVSMEAAIALKRELFSKTSVKLVLFNHDVKPSMSQQVADEVDAVLSVGQKIFDHFSHESQAYYPLKADHVLYFPLPEDKFFNVDIRKPNFTGRSIVQLLTVYEEGDVDDLDGYRMFASALSNVVDRLSKAKARCLVQWKICGVPKHNGDQFKENVNNFITSNRLEVQYLHNDCKNMINHMKASHAFVTPSRCKPFGMMALEVIAMGVPILLTKNSGLAYFLENEFRDYAKVVAVDVGVNNKKIKDDIKKWEEKIHDILHPGEYSQIFDKANLVKQGLKNCQAIKESKRQFQDMLSM